MSDYTPFPVWPRPSDEGGGVTSHGALTGRSSADQHPVGAITGLTAALVPPASTFTYVTDGDGGYDLVGGPYVEGSARIFIGPDDPDTAGFTLVDGDQWKDTSA